MQGARRRSAKSFRGGFQGDFFKNPPETQRQRALPFVVQAETRKRGLFEKSPLLTPAKTFRQLTPGCRACAPKVTYQPVRPAARRPQKLSGNCRRNVGRVRPKQRVSRPAAPQAPPGCRACAPKVTRQPTGRAAGAAVLVRIMCRMTIIQHVKCTSAVSVHDSG